MTSIQASVDSYEARLRSVLGKELVLADLKSKHHKMRTDAFLFLRATCWRWAERAAEICGEISDAPTVLAVGDAHLENFGLWRDAESRLVWGVNDFDEAARTPYTFDLVRLTASALLAGKRNGPSAREITGAVLRGYQSGLRGPKPFILEEEHFWLRDLLAASGPQRVKFWKKLAKLHKAVPSARYVKALRAALPDGRSNVRLAARSAGVGSLGRPRFVAIAIWSGGHVAREAKAMIPSCWAQGRAERTPGRRLLQAVYGRFHAPDPWLDVKNGIIVRRLAPNSRKLELTDIGGLHRPLLEAMGFELANIHSSDSESARFIKSDIAKRRAKWLETAAVQAAEATLKDWRDYRRHS